jgi:hypothetical protein
MPRRCTRSGAGLRSRPWDIGLLCVVLVDGPEGRCVARGRARPPSTPRIRRCPLLGEQLSRPRSPQAPYHRSPALCDHPSHRQASYRLEAAARSLAPCANKRGSCRTSSPSTCDAYLRPRKSLPLQHFAFPVCATALDGSVMQLRFAHLGARVGNRNFRVPRIPAVHSATRDEPRTFRTTVGRRQRA